MNIELSEEAIANAKQAADWNIDQDAWPAAAALHVEIGNAHAHALFDLVKIQKKVEVPRAFADYNVAVHEAGIPQSVKLHRRVG